MTTASDPALEKKIEDAEEEIKDVKLKIKQVEGELEQVKAALEGLRAETDEARAEAFGKAGIYADGWTREDLRVLLVGLQTDLAELRRKENLLLEARRAERAPRDLSDAGAVAEVQKLQVEFSTLKRKIDEREDVYTISDIQLLERATSRSDTSKKLLAIKKERRCFLCKSSDGVEASHIVQVQDLRATTSKNFPHAFNSLRNWQDTGHWRRTFIPNDPMNLLWLCKKHNGAFDRHDFCLEVARPLQDDSPVQFLSLVPDFDDPVREANERLQDPNEPNYDLSYVSKRAVAFRLRWAAASGKMTPADIDMDGIANLSAKRSVRSASDEDEGDEISGEMDYA